MFKGFPGQQTALAVAIAFIIDAKIALEYLAAEFGLQ